MKQTDAKRKRKYAPIRRKIIFCFSVFTALILLMLWLTQIVFLEDIYQSIKIMEIKNSGKTLINTINEGENLVEQVDLVGKRNDVCILAIRISEKDRASKIASCEAIMNCAIHNIDTPAIFTLYDSALRDGGNNLQYFRYDKPSGKYLSIRPGESNGDQVSIIYSLVVQDKGGDDILFILNSVVSPVDATVRTMNYLLIAISVIMIAISVILAIIISRRISKPISEINESAKQLALGNYDLHFTAGSFKESAELSDTLNFAAYELSRVDKLRSELISNVSHDLRTPLTMITGYAEIMRDLPCENTPENAQIIIDESRRLSSLVNDMLDISKLESGNQTINPEHFNLTETLSDAMKRYNHLVEHEGYFIEFIAEGEVTVFTDRSKLLQAFYNIVNNAITYTGEDKKVIVQQLCYRDELGNGWVRILISDTGAGIPPEQLPMIWERYYKSDTPHKRALQGSGLGLSIVNKIMALLGGGCGVESTLGAGSTFWLDLPIQ